MGKMKEQAGKMNVFRKTAGSAMRLWCALALALSLVPASALGVQPSDQAEGALGEAAIASEDKPAYVEGEMLVVYNKGVSEERAMRALNRIDGVDADDALTEEALDETALEESEPVLVQLEEGADVEDAVQQAQDDPAIAYAQPNFCYYVMEDKVRSQEISVDGELAPAAVSAAELEEGQLIAAAEEGSQGSYIPNDPAFASQSTANRYMEITDDSEYTNAWHLYNMNAPQAWAAGLESQTQTVTVAVLDTGCNVTQEDIADAVWQEYAWNAYSGKKMTKDSDTTVAHGTHVCGLAAATANNAMGTAGSSLNAKVLPIGVFNSDASGASTQTIIEAYKYALQVNAQDPEVNLHVINMSLGAYNALSSEDRLLMEQIDAAEEQGIVTVCAGGNGDQYGRPITAHSYPSDYENTVAVTCLSTDGRTPTSWCDYNDSKDICAPGDFVFSTCGMAGDDTYYIMSGTSQASPVTAGAFAFLFSLDPSMTAAEAKDLLLNSANADDFDDRGRTEKYGTGRLDLEAAVNRMCGVSISNGSAQVVSGQSLQMFYAPIGSTSHTGIATASWSVAATGDGGSATIDAYNGMLEAGMPGTVDVTVNAIDSAGRSFAKTSTVSILPVEIEGSPMAQSDEMGAVILSWKPQPAAAGYRILRSLSQEGPYQEIGRVQAGAENFRDDKAAMLSRQWYKVLPYSKVSDTDTGKESSSIMGAGFAATVRVAAENTASLCTATADYSAILSEMAGTPRECAIFASADDTIAIACAAPLAAAKKGLVLVTDGTLSSQQKDLLANSDIDQAYLLGSSNRIPSTMETLLAAEGITMIKRFDTSNASTLCQQIYEEGKGEWGDEVILCNPSKPVDAVVCASYIWTKKTPIVMTAATGSTLGSSELVICSKFKSAIIVGNSASVTAAVDTRLSRQGIAVWRAGEGGAASVALADRMVQNGQGSYATLVLADGNDTAAFSGASSLASAFGSPALSIQGNADGKIAFDKLVALGKAVNRVVLCGNAAYTNTMATDARSALGGTLPSYARTPQTTGSSNTLNPATSVASENTTVIKAVPTVVLSKTSMTWTGKALKPSVKTVKVAGKTLPKSSYTVTYKNNKAVGKATVTVKLKGSYSGSKSVTFKITPKATSISKLTHASKAFTLKWKRLTGSAAKQITGYQVRYSTTKSMKSSKIKTIKGASKSSVKATKLKGGKKYYVQVRTYRTVGKTKYVSAWSKAKMVITA